MKKLIFFALLMLSSSYIFSQNLDNLHTTKIDNFHRVDKDVYRSGQPDENDFKVLEKAGLKQVLNLRNHHSDDDEAQNTNLILSRVKMNAGSLTEQELLEALTIIKNRKGPILIHCWHGSDRTGAVIALYRIIYQNWSKEEAIKELVDDKYGHHEWYYKNIPKLIRKIDIDNFKEKLTSTN